MRFVPLLLNASRCIAALTLLVSMMGAQASSGVAGKFKEGRAPAPQATVVVAKAPSMTLLALGLMGIGLHGLGRARRHQ